MKKIGIIHGMEDSFPTAFIDRINSKNIPGIVAERVTIDKVIQGEACGKGMTRAAREAGTRYAALP